MSSSTLTVSTNRLRRALGAAVSWSPHSAAIATGPADLDLPLAHVAASAARDAARGTAASQSTSRSAPRPAEVSASAKAAGRAHRRTARRATLAVRR